MKFTLKIQSVVDVITNSSTEVYPMFISDRMIRTVETYLKTFLTEKEMSRIKITLSSSKYINSFISDVNMYLRHGGDFCENFSDDYNTMSKKDVEKMYNALVEAKITVLRDGDLHIIDKFIPDMPDDMSEYYVPDTVNIVITKGRKLKASSLKKIKDVCTLLDGISHSLSAEEIYN